MSSGQRRKRKLWDSRTTGGGGGGRGSGPGGSCECPECGHKVAHERGKPCTDVRCPKCGTEMVRVG